MKLLIFLSFLAISISETLLAQDTLIVYFDKDWNEISKKEDAVYYRNAFLDSNNMWKVNDYFISKKLQMTGSYNSKKLKVRQGNFVYYYENGNVQSRGLYVNDENEGIWNYWHENGERKSTGMYSKGMKEGIWEYWYDNGKKQSEGKFIHGKKDGNWSFWNTNNELESVETYVNGDFIRDISYFNNGKIYCQGDYVKDKKQGEWIFYNAEGRVFFKGKFNNGYQVGEWIRYFPEGEMKINYVAGVPQTKGLGGIVMNE